MKRNIALLQSEKNEKKFKLLANYYQESIDLPPGKTVRRLSKD